MALHEAVALAPELNLMSKTFKRGDHVSWNSEAGRVRGVIVKKVVGDVKFKGYVHHATKEEPQYFIKSDKTDHVAIHKGTALRLLSVRPKKKGQRSRKQHAKST
jgi:Hypervirulence associated proteins TUDOR domain